MLQSYKKMPFIKLEFLNLLISFFSAKFISPSPRIALHAIYALLDILVEEVDNSFPFSFPIGKSKKELVLKSVKDVFVEVVERWFGDPVLALVESDHPLDGSVFGFEFIAGPFVETGGRDEVGDHLVVPGYCSQNHISVVDHFLVLADQSPGFKLSATLVDDADGVEIGDEVYFISGEGDVSELSQRLDGPVVDADLAAFEGGGQDEGNSKEEEFVHVLKWYNGNTNSEVKDQLSNLLGAVAVLPYLFVWAYPAFVCGVQLLGHVCQLLQQRYFLLLVGVLYLLDLVPMGQEPLTWKVDVIVVGHHFLDLDVGGQLAWGSSVYFTLYSFLLLNPCYIVAVVDVIRAHYLTLAAEIFKLQPAL